MAKKKIDRIELFMATEELLLHYGYHSFQFKLLAEKLGLGRSTLYDYYRNKEELITDYMMFMMDKIVVECEQILVYEGPYNQLRGIVQVFMKYPQIRKVIQVLPQIDHAQVEPNDLDMEKVKAGHSTLNGYLMKIISDAQSQGLIRKDMHITVIAGIIFNAIMIPNMQNIDQDSWIDTVFDAILNGIRG